MATKIMMNGRELTCVVRDGKIDGTRLLAEIGGVFYFVVRISVPTVVDGIKGYDWKCKLVQDFSQWCQLDDCSDILCPYQHDSNRYMTGNSIGTIEVEPPVTQLVKVIRNNAVNVAHISAQKRKISDLQSELRREHTQRILQYGIVSLGFSRDNNDMKLMFRLCKKTNSYCLIATLNAQDFICAGYDHNSDRVKLITKNHITNKCKNPMCFNFCTYIHTSTKKTIMPQTTFEQVWGKLIVNKYIIT
jgi:hypothetical protein